MTSKGGARRSLVPPVDLDALRKNFETAVATQGADAFKLGDYQEKSVSTAVSSAGLHHNAKYVKEFYKISEGEIPSGQLKQCILKYGYAHNDSEQCLQGATGAERQSILEIVDLPDACKKAAPGPEDDQACKKAKAAKETSSAKAAEAGGQGSSSSASLKEPEEQACKKARTLKLQVSDVSVDSHGWPAILNSPKAAKEEEEEVKDCFSRNMTILEKMGASCKEQLDKAAQEAAQELVESRPGLERRSEIQKKPASKECKKKPASKKASLPKAKSLRLERRPTEKQGPKKEAAPQPEPLVAAEGPRPERRPWSAVKKVMGKDQAYLMGLFGRDWKLIIGCTKRMGKIFPGGHHAVILELEKVAMEAELMLAMCPGVMKRGQRRQEEEAPRSTQGRLFGPSPAEAAREGLQEGQKGKSKGKAKAKEKGSGASSSRPERRPAFVPEHRPGEEDWDPFRQEARGNRGREARKALRARDPEVQAGKEKGLKEGFKEDKVQPLHEGSRKWRMIKEREKEVKEEEEQLMLERKQLLEEKAAFLEEKAAWLSKQEMSPSPARGVVLQEGPGARPERRPKRKDSSSSRPERRPKRKDSSSSRPERRPKQKAGRSSSSSYSYEYSEEEEVFVEEKQPDWQEEEEGEKEEKEEEEQPKKKDPKDKEKKAAKEEEERKEKKVSKEKEAAKKEKKPQKEEKPKEKEKEDDKDMEEGKTAKKRKERKKVVKEEEEEGQEEKQQEGLQEGQVGASEPEATQEEATQGATAEEQQEGLQEGHQPDASEEGKPAAEAEIEEAAKMLPDSVAKAAQASLKEGSEAGATLTSSRLKLHEKTQAAIQGLKEGHLSEAAFWQEISNKDRAALWKKYEGARNKDPEAKAAWLQMGGPGVLDQKKQLLLHFLKTGQAQEGGLKKSQEVANSKKEKEWFEWVPWKQILDWYGEEEALARVESGLIAVKKVGKKFYEFLLVKIRTELTLEQKKRIAELKACKKALAAARTKQEWDDLWLEKKPQKGFQVEDALSEPSETSSEHEDESSAEQHNPAASFLQGLKKGQAMVSQKKEKRNDDKQKHLVKEEKVKEEDSRACKKAQAEKTKIAKKKEADKKWHTKLEEATQVGENEKDSKVKKMLALVSKGVADLKKACKKAKDASWGADVLQALIKSRDSLEDLATDGELEGIKNHLLEAASALKAFKKLLTA
ncbi:unnamed protein product [Cladocopium goreaui]|uniref:Dynein heavy chain-like protein 2 n=1 Tax=Cladocopium goreaui TaxID=2562237 RepID=A0A9P1LZL5_9DINO|nr:unnamed protein product [Cladocopium goreaui]